MDTAYTVCMVIGIAIPLLSLVLGQLFDFFDGLFDAFDFSFEVGDTGLPFFPMSMQSICAGLLVFGTIGKLLFTGENYLFANVIAGGGAYIAAMGIQYLINWLKKIEHRPFTREEMPFFEAKVTNAILKGGYGAISVKTDSGTVSYPAKSVDSDILIPQNTLVDIIRFEKNVAIVKKAKRQTFSPELFPK